jgi:TonB family protein
MSRMRLFTLALLISSAIAQTFPETKVIVTKLSAPTYPRMALLARIAGTVELNIVVRPDGRIESIDVVSGHPMLKAAAIESAQKTEFECTDCLESLTPHRMTYKFELGEAVSCKGIDANGYGIYDATTDPLVSQSLDMITVLGRPPATCDPTVKISFLKIRSAKCLYLWHCTKRPVESDNSR